MEFLPLGPDDLSFIPSLQPEGWQDILPAITFYTQSEFCFPVKAKLSGNTVGIGCGIQQDTIGWVAHIIVHPDHRKKGVGEAITRTVMDQLRARGCKTLNLIATQMGEPIYTKIGFHKDVDYLFFKGLEKSSSNEPSNIQIRAYHAKLLSAITELDYEASGEHRMLLLQPHLASADLFIENDKLNGYYLPTLGDCLIIASTAQAGIALMALRLHEKDHACFPADNTVAKKLLYDQGYQEYRIAKRMTFGEPLAWKPGMMFNRIAGNLG